MNAWLWLGAAVLGLLCLPAHGQQRQLSCLPGYTLPDLPMVRATPLMQGTVPGVAGEWWQIWCPEVVPGKPEIVYRLNTQAVLDKYRAGPVAVLAAVLGVVQADSPLAEARRLLAGGGILPAAGTAERYDFDRLHFAACEQGKALPPPEADVSGIVCKAPVRPYVVKANGLTPTRPVYPITSGVRGASALASTIRATVGAACNQTIAQAPSTGSDLYATYAPDYRPDRVTLCTPAP